MSLQVITTLLSTIEPFSKGEWRTGFSLDSCSARNISSATPASSGTPSDSQAFHHFPSLASSPLFPLRNRPRRARQLVDLLPRDQSFPLDLRLYRFLGRAAIHFPTDRRISDYPSRCKCRSRAFCRPCTPPYNFCHLAK